MDFSDPVQRGVFFEIHSDLPRESPGSDASTVKALSFVKSFLPGRPLICDFGCGPGSSALPLAAALAGAHILALDTHAPFVREVRRRALAKGLEQQITPLVADMSRPPVPLHSVDMIWCEGALYFLGVRDGLQQWRQYLKPGGLAVFNDAVWTAPYGDLPADLKELWSEYPGMTDAEGVRAAIGQAGYTVIGEFNLPDEDWWGSYYAPMEERLAGLEARYRGNETASIPLREARTEIEMRRRHADKYAYRFFMAKIAD